MSDVFLSICISTTRWKGRWRKFPAANNRKEMCVLMVEKINKEMVDYWASEPL